MLTLGWVKGTISKTVHQRMDSFRQKQMNLDELMQLGWGDAAYYFGERKKRYSLAKCKVPAVVPLHARDDAAASALTTFGEPMETLDKVPRKLQMPQRNSRAESSHMRLGSRKLQSHQQIMLRLAGAAPHL